MHLELFNAQHNSNTMQRIVCFGFYIFYPIKLLITILAESNILLTTMYSKTFSVAKHKAKVFMKSKVSHSGNLYVKSESLHDRNTFGGKMYFGFDKSVFIEYFHYATC